MNSRILVADDQIDVLNSLDLLLKNEGFDIDAVTSPKAVVEAVESRSYDILLLDMNYARDTTSGGEGLELLSRIHELNDALPVVLMTAWSTVGLAVEAMRAGGYDFVEKPWDNRKLLDILRRNVEEGRLRQKKKSVDRQSSQVLQEIEAACQTQRGLLPLEMPQVSGIEIEVSWRPAGGVGGDYFDVIRLNGNVVAFCIADVAGKGIPAALVMSNIQATVRAYARVDRSPSEMCGHLNRVVRQNTQSTSFVTLFYGILDTACRSLAYANAGHIPPILVHRDGSQEALAEGGTILGPFPDSHYPQATVALQSGDRLILLTDGITEAVNAAGNQFGEDGRIAALLSQTRGLRPSELKDAFLDALTSFAGASLQDDATLMIVSMA
jgi:sigma-B regulation protein RsbU (phosphoserine phosphatase)